MKPMNPKLIPIVTALAISALSAFAQESPNPPNPPNAPGAPVAPNHPPPPRDRDEKKVPVTFLGVETSDVPRVVCEQLGLPKGFGLVVDYVVPNSPAATAGVQQNDILKMLNDQILTEPDQLSKLVRSYSEGTSITLTVLRKGKEEKVTVKLSKKEVPQRELERGRHGHRPFDDHDFGDFGLNEQFKEQMQNLREQLGDVNQGIIHDAVMAAQATAQQARDMAEKRRDMAQQQRDMAQRMRDQAQQIRDEAQRVRDKVREAARKGQITVNANGLNGSLSTTRIDIGKAQIVFSDDKGELRVEKIDGKKVLTAKDPQGRLLFSGAVETDEDMAKVPPEVRERYNKLQTNELPAVTIQPDQSDESESETDTDEEAFLPDQVSHDTRLPRSTIL